MNKTLISLIGAMALAASMPLRAAGDDVLEDRRYRDLADPLPEPPKVKRRAREQVVHSERQAPKPKSELLRRLLGSKGRK